MKLTSIILLLILSLYTNKMQAQFYSTGEPPASLKWHKIHTDHFKLIYPLKIDSQANRMANLLEYFYTFTVKDMKHPMKRKISVVLHSSSVVSNGFVALAPERMELVTTPAVESYAQDWLSQLALHESRHVVQLNYLNQGLTKGLGYITGEISRGLTSSMIPSWFYEGDAVYNETRYSGSGRGRTAGFSMPLRTLVMERPVPYSYDKAVFGSYRDYVPDHYQYGYAITTYGRTVYGKSMWIDGLRFVARNPYMIWPLAFYLKKYTGRYKSGLYKDTMDSLKSQYYSDKTTDTYSDYIKLSGYKDALYNNYIHPHEISNGKVLAISQGLRDAGSLVEIGPDHSIKKIRSIGNAISPRLDCSKTMAVWDEIVLDPRWERRDYSIIKTLDLRTLKVKRIAEKTRYFSPCFSPDGNKLAVIEITPENLHFLVVLNVEQGRVLQRIEASGREIKYPIWLSETKIAVISVNSSGKAIESVDTQSEMWSILYPHKMHEIADLARYNHYILFRSAGNETDNLFALDVRPNGKCFQITHSLHGAYYPSVSYDSSSILFSDYSLYGFDVTKISIDTSKWLLIEPGYVRQPITEEPLNDTSYFRQYPYRRFNKLLDVFNLHSWLPFYTDINKIRNGDEDVDIIPGFILLSQNRLGTIISSLGYGYSGGFHFVRPSISIRAWYPVIEFSGLFGGPQQSIGIPEGVSLPVNAIAYNEFTLKTFVPLRFSSGDRIIRIQPEFELERSSVWHFEHDILRKGISFAHFKLNAAIFKRMTVRNLYPKWGQTLLITMTGSPWQDLFGTYQSLSTTTYLPGLLHNHHFFIKAGLQFQFPEMYYMPLNRLSFPRGYLSTISREMGTLSLNYSFTAAYPDLAAGPIFYIKRISMNMFYDHAYGSAVRHPGSFNTYGYINSCGLETWADMHVIRFILPVSAGIRTGYLPERNMFFAEFLLSINTGIF